MIMRDKILQYINQYAYQVCFYNDFVAIWVRDEEARNAILLGLKGMRMELSKMKGSLYIIKIYIPDAVHYMLGVE